MQDLSMNPQKLAGQCAKLKCCLNFEVDSYAEASRQLPPKDAVLETKDGSFFYFKPDILTRRITYSSDKNIPSNLVTISAGRAFEIIALNKQGIKVDTLNVSQDNEPQAEYGDIIGQDSLTRFDKNRKKKKKNQRGSQNPQQTNNPQNRQDRQDRQDRRQNQNGNHQNGGPQKKNGRQNQRPDAERKVFRPKEGGKNSQQSQKEGTKS